ncbi:MAG: PilZ domain-containing protein [Pseudomonadota bacterium]
MTMSDEQRKHIRLNVESTVFIEMVSPGIGGATSDKAAVCKSLDISRGGLRVGLNQSLSEGAIMQIGVDVPGADGTLYLTGEVRWCLQSPQDEHAWTAGFELIPTKESDIERWTEMLADLES